MLYNIILIAFSNSIRSCFSIGSKNVHNITTKNKYLAFIKSALKLISIAENDTSQ